MEKDNKQILRETLAQLSSVNVEVKAILSDWNLKEMEEVVQDYNNEKGASIAIHKPDYISHFFFASLKFDHITIQIRSKEVEVNTTWKFKKTA